MKKSVYYDKKFTDINQTIKTYTLELVPDEKTLETINKYNWIASDKEVLESIKNEKSKLIDEMLVDCSSQALADTANAKSVADIFDLKRALKEEKDAKAIRKISKDLQALVEEYTKLYTSNLSKILGVKKPSDIRSADFLTNTPSAVSSYFRDKDRLDVALAFEADKGCTPLYKLMMISKETAIGISIPRRFFDSNIDLYMYNQELFKNMDEIDVEFKKTYSDELDTYKTTDGYELTMNPAGIEAYNELVGAYNSAINEYLQLSQKDEHKKSLKFFKAKKLDKYILAPQVKEFAFGQIETNEELIEVLDSYIESKASLFATKDFVNYIDNDIFIYSTIIHRLSYVLFDDHDLINEALTDKCVAKQHKSYYALSDILDALAMSLDDFKQKVKDKVDDLYNNAEDLIIKLEDSGYKDTKYIKSNAGISAIIKDTVTAVNDCFDIYKLFKTKDLESVLNDRCIEINSIQKQFNSCFTKIFNFLTKTVKTAGKNQRVFFGTPSFLSLNWYSGVMNDGKFYKSVCSIIKEEDKYYFVIPSPESKPMVLEQASDDEFVEFLKINKIADAVKALPKQAFPKKVREFFDEDRGNVYVIKPEYFKAFAGEFVLSKEVYEVYKNKLYTKDALVKGLVTEEEYKDNVCKLITYYKRFIDNYTSWSAIDFSSLKEASEYGSFLEFAEEVDRCGLNMEWMKISKSQIDALVDNGTIFKMLIKNQNMYKDTTNKTEAANILLACLSDANFKEKKIQLNSNPAMYFRPHLLEPTEPTHKKGDLKLNKTDKNGEHIPSAIYYELYEYYKKRITKVELSKDAKEYLDKDLLVVGVFDYDINAYDSLKRDMFKIQLSYTINNDITPDYYASRNLTAKVDEVFKTYLTVTRDSFNLLYYALEDKNGKVLEKGSLNNIGTNDYKSRLKALSYDRYRSKSNEWIYDKKVSDFKNYYIQDAVSFISKKALEHNSVVIVDKAVDSRKQKSAFVDMYLFSDFEDKLRAKFSNVTNRRISFDEIGSTLHPINLSANSSAWEDGIVRFMPSSFTNLDKSTGFVNVFDLSKIVDKSSILKFFDKFEEIVVKDSAIIFKFDYNNFTTSIKLDKTKWELKLEGQRNVRDLKEKSNKLVDDVVAEVKNKLDLRSGDLREQMQKWSFVKLNYFYNIFKNMLFCKLYLDDEVRYISPVTSKEQGEYSEYRCKMLSEKYRFFEEHKTDENGNELDYAKKTVSWINSYY